MWINSFGKLACLLGVTALGIPLGHCQKSNSQPQGQIASAESSLPQFEVATIKPNPKGGAAGVFVFPGGKVRASFCTVELLIRFAFDAQPFEISNAPGWTHTERYDIDAIPSPNAASSRLNPPSPNFPLSDEQRQMLQALLRDRFQLKFHRTSGIGPVYVLVKGKGNLKLEAAQDETGSPMLSIRGGITGKNMTMPLVASRLSRFLGRPILDETQLAGAFDFQYAYDGASEGEDYTDLILSSVRGLGLELKADKRSTQTMVIDQVEKPVEN